MKDNIKDCLKEAEELYGVKATTPAVFEHGEVGKPVYRNPETSEMPEPGKAEVVYASWDKEPAKYDEGAFMTWNPVQRPEFGFPEAANSVAEILEPEEAREVMTDGGEDVYTSTENTKMAGPMGPGTKGPEGYKTDEDGYGIPDPMGGYFRDERETISEVEHTHSDYEDGAPL